MEPGKESTQLRFHHQEEEFIYIVGRERRDFDVCDYPKLKKRQFRCNENRQLVDWEDLNSV